MNSGRVVNVIFTLAFAAVAVFAAVFLYRDYQHLDHTRKEKALLEQRLGVLRKESSSQEAKVAKLNEDPEYVEKVIREKLDYAKQDEVIFRFE